MAITKATDSGKNAEVYVKTGGVGVCGDVYIPDSVYGLWSYFTSNTAASADLAGYGAGRVSVNLNGTEYYIPIFTTD